MLYKTTMFQQQIHPEVLTAAEEVLFLRSYAVRLLLHRNGCTIVADKQVVMAVG
jgi:hypothetical protein